MRIRAAKGQGMGHFLRNTSRFAALVILCALATPALADIQDIRNSDNEIWGAAGPSFFNYKEPSTAPNLPDSEHGTLPSLAAGASMLVPDSARGFARNLYLSLDSSITFGDAHYSGAYFYFPTTPLQGTTSETIWTVDGKIGKAFPVNSAMMLIPYAELGYRYWDRSLSSTQDEDYQNFDILAGLMVQASPINRLTLTGYGSAGSTFAAQMNTAGSTYDLGSDAMYKIGAKLGYALTKQLELFTTLDYDHFNYGQSGVVAGAYEPNSMTEDTTWRVGLGYQFK